MENKIIIKQTGEILDMNAKIEAMTDKERSVTLTQINYIRKNTAKLEKMIKEFIKKNVELEFEENVAMYEDWRITEVYSNRFSEKALRGSGNKKDIKEWERLKDKYSKGSSSLRFG